ncbi:MAG TPA: glycosyltransferase [Nocardioides sp.]|nr:glycosyltransferase [Nocardioides sp.]
MNSSVAALIVSHDGARWLPAVIEGLGEQRTPVDAVVAVDTTSRDGSAELLREAFGSVVEAHGSTSFPAAVSLGLEQLGDCEWIWILHDDSRPEPGALEALMRAAEAHPDVDVLGPKLREWPSLRRLLELGVTISGTGRRETGLERGEYDQGQHDEIRTVLAVNTAGMLVRRTVLEELGGFDAKLPIFGNDIDFGWRAAAAGHRTIVVPEAVVFHAEAAHRGVRRTPITGRHTHYQERRAALYTLLANAPAKWLPFQVLRLGLGTLIRMIGFLLVRQVGQALDELAAIVSLYSSPRELIGARRTRAERRPAEPHDVRHLLAPRWLPYRHGLDFVSDLAAAATDQASDVAERRRAAKLARDGTPVRRTAHDDEDDLGADSGFVVRFLTNPVAVVVSLFLIVALVGARDAFGAVSGGALSPPPGEAADWWNLHLEAWHALGQGTPVPAPAYVLPLAVLASLLGGSPAAAMSALLVLAVPVSAWGAWRLLRVIGHLVDVTGFRPGLIAWGALSYSLVPVVSGAWGEGRFGVVAAAALLPWLAHAALGFADPEADRRWRAAWRTALFIALGAAFEPMVFWVGVVLALVVVGTGFLISPQGMRDRSVWGPPAAALASVPLLLAPWWLPAVLNGAGAGLLLDAGRLPMAEVGFQQLVLGRLGDAGAPWWLGLGLVVLAAVALIPRATRIPVLVCWVVALGTAVLAAMLGLVVLDFPTITTGAGLGFLVVLLQGLFLVAAVIGGHGILSALPPTARWRRPVVATGALLAAVVPAVGLGWFALGGHSDLGDEADTGIPAYMTQTAMTGPAHGILVIRGEVSDGLDYSILRDDGITVGEDEIVALSAEEESMTRDVRELAAGPSPDVARELADHGIEYVVLPAPADGTVASALDATAGLSQASAENRSTRAWQVEREVAPDAVDGPDSALRVLLLVVQVLAILVVAVLAAPTTGRERR